MPSCPPLYISLDIFGQDGGKEELQASGVESGRAQLRATRSRAIEEGRYTQGGEVNEQEYQEKANNGDDEKRRLFTTRRAGWTTSTRRIRTRCSPIQGEAGRHAQAL